MIRCSWHNYVFRLADGKGINYPGHKLRIFDVKLENGALYAPQSDSTLIDRYADAIDA